jgi:hypothetical protein
MKKLVCGALMLVALSANAQKFSGGLNLQLTFPEGEYKIVNGTTGVGGRLDFHYKPFKQVPVSVGIDLAAAVVGSNAQSFYTTFYGFYDEYRVNASNNIFSLMFDVRIDPVKDKALLRPFVDVKVGWNDFFSTVTVDRVTYNSSSGASNSNSSKARWSMAYGGSAGVDIRLTKKGNIYLEFKTTYLEGAKSKYLVDPIFNNNGSVSFTEKESETNMLIPQLGVRLNF